MKSTPRICKLIDDVSRERILCEASQILRQGGVVVCATDTGYLLGGDGLNISAIRKVYTIKGRSFDKPIHLVVPDIATASRLAEMDERAERIFRQFLPGPLTVILKKKPVVPDRLVNGLAGVGLRIPENDFLLELVKTAKVPITATSANRSGQATPFSVEDVLSELGPAVEYVNLIIDQGETPHAMPSTILDMTQTPPIILREGPITIHQLRQHGIL